MGEEYRGIGEDDRALRGVLTTTTEEPEKEVGDEVFGGESVSIREGEAEETVMCGTGRLANVEHACDGECAAAPAVLIPSALY